MLSRCVQLNTQANIPIVGLGVFQASDAKAACLSALKLGYRHIDTAQYYENEAEVGAAVKESGINRSELFITTKVWIDRFSQCEKSVRESLKKLQLDYIDLVLLHAPVEGERMQAWKALEKLYNEGVCRAIGVSNYGVHHLEELLSQCTVPPAVNQIELHPFFFRKNIVDFCQQNKIIVQAYSPLAKGQRMNDATISKIAQETGKTYAQVMLRWALKKVPVILPKSNATQRQRENSDLDFEFTEAQMKALDSLSSAKGSCTWDPTTWK